MIRLYTDQDLLDAHRQRGRILAVFFAVLFAYLALLTAFIIYYVSLPYADPNGIWVQWVVSIASVLFVFFCFPFMGIKFKRCNAYYKMLRFITVGLKECSIAPFAGIEDWTTKDGVDVNVASFTVRGVKRNETMIRQIFIDGEKDYPPFYEGDVVKFVTQGNLLIAYEIIKEAERLPEGEEPLLTEQVDPFNQENNQAAEQAPSKGE